MQFPLKKNRPNVILLFLHRYWVDFNIFGCFGKSWDMTFGYNAFAHLFLWKIMMGRGRFFAIQYFYFGKIIKNINFVGNLSNQQLSLRQNYSVHNPVPKLIFSQKMWANTLTLIPPKCVFLKNIYSLHPLQCDSRRLCGRSHIKINGYCWNG